MNFILLLVIVFIFPRNAQAGDARSRLFPNWSEQNGQGTSENLLAYEMRSCFSEMHNGHYPSGYARFKIIQNKGPFDVQLERSTNFSSFIESCLSSHIQKFRNNKEQPKGSHAHIISQCRPPQMGSRSSRPDCQVHVILNNFSENKELDLIIEKHWKESLQDPQPYRLVLDLIMLLHTMSKK